MSGDPYSRTDSFLWSIRHEYREELVQAYEDFRNGKFGHLAD